MSLFEGLIVVLAGLISGFINTLASSGSAVSLTALMELGLPAPVANGTNRLGIVLGCGAAVIAFHRQGVMPWKAAPRLLVPTVLGSALGAWLAALMDAKQVGWAVLIALLIAAALLLSDPKRLIRAAQQEQPRPHWAHHLLFFGIGIWIGFIVLDSATYMLLALVLVLKYDLARANAVKNLLLVAASVAAIAIFQEKHEISWPHSVVLSIGSIAGGYGAGIFAAKESAKIWTMRLLVCIVIFEALNLGWKYFFSHVV